MKNVISFKEIIDDAIIQFIDFLVRINELTRCWIETDFDEHINERCTVMAWVNTAIG